MAESSNHITRGPKDRTRVDIDQLWEVQWWSKGFGVTAQEVLDAVREVGPLVADLDRHFRRGA